VSCIVAGGVATDCACPVSYSYVVEGHDLLLLPCGLGLSSHQGVAVSSCARYCNIYCMNVWVFASGMRCALAAHKGLFFVLLSSDRRGAVCVQQVCLPTTGLSYCFYPFGARPVCGCVLQCFFMLVFCTSLWLVVSVQLDWVLIRALLAEWLWDLSSAAG
jgi:hypothetical protein